MAFSSQKFLIAAFTLGACDCGPASSLPDTGSDILLEDTVDVPDEDSSTLPTVEAMGPSCADFEEHGHAACIEQGWFLFYRYQALTTHQTFGRLLLPIPAGPTYLDSFWLDRTEVSQGDYAAFAAGNGIDLPPSSCGYKDDYSTVGDIGMEVPEFADEVPETRADHPVICVTRHEAQAYCEAQGGRLPTVAEWMKAGQPMWPESHRFPWGDSPPEGQVPSWHHQDLQDHYAMIGTRSGAEPMTVPVGSRIEGVSPYGVFDLAGNVSEILADCHEQLGGTYGLGDLSADAMRPMLEPLVRPDAEVLDACAQAVIVAGSNWRSYHADELLFAQSIWAMYDGQLNWDVEPPAGFRPTGVMSEALTLSERMFGKPEAIADAPATGPGNERRSWRVGFRCAYDSFPGELEQ